MTTLQALKDDLCRYPGKSQEYVDKMLHRLPECREVDRIRYIAEHCKGKRVLDVGATGNLHKVIEAVARECFGISEEAAPGVQAIDLDDLYGPECFQEYPKHEVYSGIELMVVGEVLEHLSNPGYCLDYLISHYRCPAIFSVPNAFSATAQKWLKRGAENVNDDHVSWYSPKTLGNLLTRAGYRPVEWCCYNGASPWAEGWIVRCEA